ncbi:HigA family addiction module antitoxin [Bordetella genomosp. 13]|uniref:HigA family addiction module antitoxin n=1 Tax=Bordetella genomosp. 13 TaxID=463040 RepID=UPI0011A0BCAF|nr:HigA family addiction module antitoxin [Bordetella genomosp. 13]
MRMFNPPHPGEVLREYLGDLSVTEAATHLQVTRAMLSRILNGHAAISAEMALRLSQALGTSADLWLGMQAQYDLWQAEHTKGARRVRIKRFKFLADASALKREDQDAELAGA